MVYDKIMLHYVHYTDWIGGLTIIKYGQVEKKKHN